MFLYKLTTTMFFSWGGFARIFEEIPYPNWEERKSIALELGLHPIQVKFWFQNQLSQAKVTHKSKNLLHNICRNLYMNYD